MSLKFEIARKTQRDPPPFNSLGYASESEIQSMALQHNKIFKKGFFKN